MVTTAAVEYTQKEQTFLPCKEGLGIYNLDANTNGFENEGEKPKKKKCETETQGIPSSE